MVGWAKMNATVGDVNATVRDGELSRDETLTRLAPIISF